jgi:hypothetical protein
MVRGVSQNLTVHLTSRSTVLPPTFFEVSIRVYRYLFLILWNVVPLLGNDRETNKTTDVTRQRPLNSNRGTVFSVRSVPSCYKQDSSREDWRPRVEAGSNTSTVTLQVVGGDEKGGLKSEIVKYGRESQGTWTTERLRRQGPAAYIHDRPILSSESAPHPNQTVTVTHVIKIWS